jgi:mono/diheme cytochrome c family protein
MKAEAVWALGVVMWLSTCSPADGGSGPLPEEWNDASPERGEVLFVRHCAICHGVRGDGGGARAGSLSSHPRDFTNPVWSRDRTPGEVFRTIEGGIEGTAMPGWAPVLTGAQRWDVVAYVLSLGRE